MVFSVIKIVPSPRQRAQVLEILHSVADLTWPSPGCVGCSLSEEDSLQKPIRYTEQWESEEALHTHLRSELYRRLLGALELSKQEPEVRFYYTTQTKGFELVEAVRNRPNPDPSYARTSEPKISRNPNPDPGAAAPMGRAAGESRVRKRV